MNADIQQLLSSLVEGALWTVFSEVAILGVLGAVLSVFLVLIFKIATNTMFGIVAGKWANTWKAVWIFCLLLLPCGGFVIGGGEGLLRGSERALRESEFGAKTVPAIAQQSVYLYAVVYFADPATLHSGNASDLAALGNLDEVRSFARGQGTLDTQRLNARLEQLKATRITDLAHSARNDFAELTPALGDDFPGLQTASKMVMEYAVTPPELDGLTAADALGPLFDVNSAAGLHGDPSRVSRDELAEHLRERVAIPGLLAPLKLLVRPWQLGAAIAMAMLLLILLITRFSVTSRNAAAAAVDDQTARE